MELKFLLLVAFIFSSGQCLDTDPSSDLNAELTVCQPDSCTVISEMSAMRERLAAMARTAAEVGLKLTNPGHLESSWKELHYPEPTPTEHAQSPAVPAAQGDHLPTFTLPGPHELLRGRAVSQPRPRPGAIGELMLSVITSHWDVNQKNPRSPAHRPPPADRWRLSSVVVGLWDRVLRAVQLIFPTLRAVSFIINPDDQVAMSQCPCQGMPRRDL
ncbi:unnamed protein product [Gadus morhua 'NCC']